MNDNSLGIREARATVAASELDVAMQPYIDSGNYSKEQLAEIRKRLANKLKEQKEQQNKVKEQPKVVEEKKVEDETKKEPELKGMDKVKDLTLTMALDAATIGGYSAYKGYKKRQNIKKEQEAKEFEEKHKETKEKLVDIYGTSDRDEIIANELTNDDGTIKRDQRLTELAERAERDDRTVLGNSELPTWDDKDIMDYIYSPYIEDYGFDPGDVLAEGLEWLTGTEIGTGTELATPENERQKRVLHNRFYSGNTDRTNIVDIINSKRSKVKEGDFDSKYKFEKGLDRISTQWADVAQLSGFNKEVYDLFQEGKRDEAIALNEENGMYTLYNKDGKYYRWEDLSDDDKAGADPNNIATVSKEDEEKAIILAERNQPANLALQHKQNYHDLVAASNMYKDVHGEVGYNFKQGVGSVKIGDSKDAFNNAMDYTGKNGELIAGHTEIVGDDEVSRNYNEALKKFLITGRALELNQDISKLAEEPGLLMLAYRPDEFAEYTADEQVEMFPDYMREIGVVMDDDWRAVAREGGDWWGGISVFGEEIDTRQFIEGGRDFVSHIAPLIASLAIAKKLPIGFRFASDIKTRATVLSSTGQTLGGAIAKRFTGVGNWAKAANKSRAWKNVVDLSLAGAEELVYFSLADQVGGRLFNMDPMIYDPKTDELHWEFAFGLGVGNKIGQKIIKNLSFTKRGSAFLSRVEKVAILDKALQGGLGATAGVSAMELAKIFSGDSEIINLLKQDIDFSKFTEEGFETEADYRAYIISQNNEMKAGVVKQMASDWIGMFAIGMFGPGSGTMRAMQKTIDDFNINYRNVSKASKKLGLKENDGTGKIDVAAFEKEAEIRAKIKNGKISKEKGEKEIAAIRKAANEMHGRHDIETAKKMIAADKKRLAELERQLFVARKRAQYGEKTSAQEAIDLAKISDKKMNGFSELDYLLLKMNDPMAAAHMAIHVKDMKMVIDYVNDFKNITNKKAGLSTKERNKLIEETLDYMAKQREIKLLEVNPAVNKAKIELLKEKLKPITEAHKNNMKRLETLMERAVAQEMLIAKKIAESLGAEFEIAKNTEDYLAKGGEKGTAGEYIDGKILVNPEHAAKARTIGTGIHEVVHYILRDAFKETYTVIEKGKKVEKRRVSEEGVAIIDKFLDTLTKAERGVIYKRLNKNYKVRDKAGVVKVKDQTYEQKSKYYEEILTTYVESLKNKDIKLDRTNGEKIQDIFIPYLQKVFTNIGRKEIKFSTEDANSLKAMLNDIYGQSEILAGVSKYEVKNFMKENPVKTADAFEAFTLEKAFSKFPEMDRINEIGEKYTREEWKGPDSDPMSGKWKEGYEEMIPDIIKVIMKKAGEANGKYPGIIDNVEIFAWEVVNELGGLNPNQVKLGGHVRNFNVNEKKYTKEDKDFGLSGWINGFANQKLLNVLKRADKVIRPRTISISEEGVKELVDPNAIEIIETRTSNETARRILLESEKPKLHEVMADVQTQKGRQAKEIHDSIRERFTNKEGIIDVNKLMETVKGKKMKNLPRLVLPETVELFIKNLRVEVKEGIFVTGDRALAEKIANKIETKSNLDQTDIIILQKGLDKWIPMIAEYVIPEGFITKEVKGEQVPSETTGVPKKVLAITHNKRSIAGVTTIDGKKVRTKENYFGQYKKPVTLELLADLREAIGIMKDGTRNINTRNNMPVKGLEGVGETLKGVVSLTERMFTSQPTREMLAELGKTFESTMLAIADGKPPKSYNKVQEKATFEKLMASWTVDVQGTAQFVAKTISAKETMTESQFQSYKINNGEDVVSFLENYFIEANPGAQGLPYNKYVKRSKETPVDVAESISEGGIALERLFEKGNDAIDAQKDYNENTVIFVENSHPIVVEALGKNKNALGYKDAKGRAIHPTAEHLIMLPSEMLSTLSKAKADKLIDDYKEIGIEIESISNSVPMIKKTAKVKNALNTLAWTKEGYTTKEKLAAFEKSTSEIKKWNEGNKNLLKALVETERILYAEPIDSNKKIPGKYIHLKNQLQTNIVEGIRALSTWKYHYVVDGKMLPDGTVDGKRHAPASKIKPAKPKGMSKKDFYETEEYRRYIKDWKETVEWSERYNINIKDPATKDGALKNEIDISRQAELRTIDDLSWGNEHIEAMATTSGHSTDYVFSNGKVSSLDIIANGHASAWAPNYIRKLLDKPIIVDGKKVDNKVSLEGDLRLTKFLPSNKLANMYTLEGRKALEHIVEQQDFKLAIENAMELVLKSNNTIIKNTVGEKAFSKINVKETLKTLTYIDKAINLGRLSKKRKGMSAWDFDDTLARTKSGVRYTLPNPSGKPQPGRKVIFMAGGAGSGKSNVIRQLKLKEYGFKIVNQDIALEWLMENHGMPRDMRDYTSEQFAQFSRLSGEARRIAVLKKMKYQGKGDGVIVDGTGASRTGMEQRVQEFKDKGYDVSMIFVETSLETALKRNAARKERTLKTSIVENTWENVMANKESFKEMFGETFTEINTNNLKMTDPMYLHLFPNLQKYIGGYKKGRLDPGEYADKGMALKAQGAKFDFTEFDYVKEGKKGPLFGKAIDRAKKYGTKDQFIVTARPHAAKESIHEFLKSQGLNIPLKNIITLESSSAEAKAMWMLKKFSEGYNDMYFADDAMQNVKAVRDVLNQLDIKSKVQQAKQFSRVKLSEDFNKIIEESFNVEAKKSYSEGRGRIVGKGKGKWKFFGTPGAEDLAGLVTYAFAGKGKQGEAHKKFFEDNLHKPFNRAYNDIHARKQNISNDYKALRKQALNVRKRLNDTVDGIYTVDQAIRVHLWDRAGFEIPGLTKTSLKKLTEYVRKDAELLSFADQLSKITMLKDGYLKPKDYWLGENITADMNNVVERVYRKEALSEFIENRKAIFGEWQGGRLVGENMNKIESLLGPKHREALESMLWAMESGKNRPAGTDSNTNRWMNWVNNSVGVIMFFNQKSAALQTISAVNYINGNFNNPFAAARAFANQPQYWKDFMTIMNSDMLVQRRAGLRINVEAAELMEKVGSGDNAPSRALSWLLQKGFIPTKYADSFAIASGGATYYRNAIRKYKKQGLSEKEAEKKAWEDFTEITEATQQSSRPDLISMQQRSGLGRPILAFANTPMQMFRRHKRRIQDIANNRGNMTENVLSAVYYGAVQTMIFSYLANAMFAVDDESDDPKDIAFHDKKKDRHINTIIDSYLRGMGTGGAAVAALKNGIVRAAHENKKDYNADYGNVVIDMLNVSPPIGSKARKIYSAGKTWKYNKEVIPEMGLSLDNPAVLAIANVISATTNIPLDRIVMKAQNLKDASNSDFESWQRIAMFMGLNKWALGVEDEELEAKKEAIEKRVKKTRKREKGNYLEKQKQERKEGKKDVKCADVSKSGNRCRNIAESGSSYCTIHARVTQRASGKKTQCKGTKTNGKRCKMQTSSKSGYCYYHD